MAVLFLFGLPSTVWGYPIEGFAEAGLDQANNLSQSINTIVQEWLQVDLFKALGSSSSGRVFEDFDFNLINADNFSHQDIIGIGKAILVLFLQIVITAVGVLLGILKVGLELLISWR